MIILDIIPLLMLVQPEIMVITHDLFVQNALEMCFSL